MEAPENSAADSKPLSKKGNWHGYAFGALLAALTFASLATFFYTQMKNPEPEIGKTSTLSEATDRIQTSQSIAVMPLVNMSSLEENEYFAGGIHEDILTNILRIEDLQVISRTTMLRYATSDWPCEKLAQNWALITS